MRHAEEFVVEQSGQSVEQHEVMQTLSELEEEMLLCANGLQFERAAVLRDQIRSLKELYHIDDAPRQPRRSSRTRSRA